MPSPAYRGRNVVVVFELDRKGIARCAMGPELRASVMLLAENEAKPYAISISPRSDRQHQHYADSFSVVPDTVVIRAMRRVAANLVNSAQHAAAVEWGNDQVPTPHRVLGRTLDHLNTPQFGHLA